MAGSILNINNKYLSQEMKGFFIKSVAFLMV